MSTLQKFKQYIGIAPLDEYEDGYFENEAPVGAARRNVRTRDGYDYDEREYSDYDGYRGPSRRDDYDGPADDQYNLRGAAPRDYGRREPVRAGGGRSFGGPAVEGALAKATVRAEDSSSLAIAKVQPRSFDEALTIGERFREGSPVIIDLVNLTTPQARRLVDFAAGLAFALGGSVDKVAAKVFLLSPSGLEVSADEKRRIAETGFFQS